MSRKETGFFESLLNAITGTGTTITRTTDCWGRKKTIVTNYDTGTTKEYTHGCGFFGSRTDVKIEKRGKTIGHGHVRKDFCGRDREHIEYKNGTCSEGVLNAGFFGNRVERKFYGKSGKLHHRENGQRGLFLRGFTYK